VFWYLAQSAFRVTGCGELLKKQAPLVRQAIKLTATQLVNYFSQAAEILWKLSVLTLNGLTLRKKNYMVIFILNHNPMYISTAVLHDGSMTINVAGI